MKNGLINRLGICLQENMHVLIAALNSTLRGIGKDQALRVLRSLDKSP